MTDKVQKIREEVARIQLYTQSEVLKQVLDYIDSLQEEPVSEKKCIFTKDNYTDEDRKVLCEDCKEKCEYSKKEHLWKPADGDDLPEYEREVVAFQEIFPTDVDVPSLLKIVIAHRPNPNGWEGKSITTGEVEHYTPKTYGKGGWNIPDVKYWLDVELPKEIEL